MRVYYHEAAVKRMCTCEFLRFISPVAMIMACLLSLSALSKSQMYSWRYLFSLER